METWTKPNYQLSEQIYESSDKKIRIFKVLLSVIFNIIDKTKKDNRIFSS